MKNSLRGNYIIQNNFLCNFFIYLLFSDHDIENLYKAIPEKTSEKLKSSWDELSDDNQLIGINCHSLISKDGKFLKLFLIIFRQDYRKEQKHSEREGKEPRENGKSYPRFA